MVIQLERLYLFETLLTDPFIFEKTDGISVTMSPTDDRFIELLDIDKAVFYVDTVLKGGLQRTKEYGGEDFQPFTANAKHSSEYSLEFNMPLENESYLEQMIGKEFSIVGMRRDLSLFTCFARFRARPLDIDNELLQRIELRTDLGNHIMYEVENLNVTEVINIIGNTPPIFPGPVDPVFGFDYPIESAMN